MRIWTLEHWSEQNTIHRSSDAQTHTHEFIVHKHFMQLFTLYTDSEQEDPETGSIIFLEECQIANCQVSDFS